MRFSCEKKSDWDKTRHIRLLGVRFGLLSAFAPKCVVVIGNGALELDNDLKRGAFEMFRLNSKDVEIITYDELFRKLEVLASLFSLTRQKQK